MTRATDFNGASGQSPPRLRSVNETAGWLGVSPRLVRDLIPAATYLM